MESSCGEGKRKNETLEGEAEITKSSSSSSNEAVLCTIHDHTSPAYAWLLPGWLAEERHMMSGRVYRYYYDPTGRAYRSQSEVVAAWEQLGVVLIDN